MEAQRSKAATTVLLLLYLALFAQLGVITRVFVTKGFELGCSGQWGPCLEGGIYFKDLPANMLGSWVIGLFVASTTAGLATDKPLTLLPASHPWQRNLELQIGVRTGFCGCLTTFASWQVELMQMAINQNLWVNAVAGFVVGLYACIMSYVLGVHTALAVDRWLLREGEDVLSELERYRSRELEIFRGVRPSAGPLDSRASVHLLEEEPDLPRNVEVWRVPSETAQQAERGGGTAGQDGSAAGGGGVSDGAVAGAGADAAEKPPAAPARLAWLWTRTDWVAALLLALSTAGLAVGVGLETRHLWLRQIWLSSLIGPAGCWLRWYFSRFNYRLPGAWAWLPAGTLGVNMAGTLVDAGLGSVLQRVPSLGYWGALAANAGVTGFSGCLTTVSTFVTEIVKFADLFPDQLHAYTYPLVSLAGGAALYTAAYGWTAWS